MMKLKIIKMGQCVGTHRQGELRLAEAGYLIARPSHALLCPGHDPDPEHVSMREVTSIPMLGASLHEVTV
jgi:hypothetical protein